LQNYAINFPGKYFPLIKRVIIVALEMTFPDIPD